MKKKYTFRKWIALFLSIAMIAASGITTNLHMRAAESTDVEETAAGEAADGTTATGEVDSQAAGGEAAGEADGSDESGKSGETTSSVSDEEKEEVLSEQEQIAQACEGATNTTYSYQDDNISVTAVLDNANAVPDNAKFRVTPITKDTAGYNYNAYMDALNDEAAASSDSGVEKQYSDENTLLYDMAFIYEVTVQKEDGSTEQKEVEVQPAKGAVKISVDFKKGQLTDTLDAKSGADVEIKHLPLTDQVKADTDTTAAATDITASDIKVEDVSGADVSVDSQKAEFASDSFSVFSISKEWYQKDGKWTDKHEFTNYWDGSTQITLSDITSHLGNLINFAVVAKDLQTDHHIEGNVRVGQLTTDGSLPLNEATNFTTNTVYDSITVNKTVSSQDSAKKKGSFQFVTRDEEGNAYDTFTITTDQSGTGSYVLTADNAKKTFDALKNAKTIHVYELNNGQAVEEGQKCGDFTVSYTYSSDSVTGIQNGGGMENDIGHFSITNEGDTRVSLVGELSKTGKEAVIRVGDTFREKENGDVVFDNVGKARHSLIVQNAGGAFTYTDGLQNAINSEIDNLGSYSSVLATGKNGAVEGDGVSVINLISTRDDFESDLKAAGFDQNFVTDLGNGYLLVNIDLGSKTSYSMGTQDLKIDGNSLQNNWSPYAGRIIYNFVTKNADGSYSPYNGTININRYTTGMILSPEATVDQTGAMLIGSVIANTVKHSGQEIHKVPITIESRKNFTVNVLNADQNQSKSASAEITAKKKLTGRAIKDGEFSFTLEAQKNAPMPKAAKDGKLTVTNTGDSVNFGSIMYDKAGTYQYTISEDKGSLEGVTYDTSRKNVTVTVEDNGSGALTASVSGDGEAATFTNSYSHKAAEVSVRFTGRKTLEGRDLKEGEFQFDLKDPDGNILQTVSNGADGTISFKPVEYTKAGTYRYFISEEVPNGTDSTKEAGVTYDAAVYPVTVTVTDDGSGELKAEVSGRLNADGSGADFKNTYKAESASVTLGGHKNVEGIKNSDQVFRFTLSENGQVIDTKTVTGEGDYRFDPIKYTGAGDHTYTVAEAAGDAAGYTYDTKTYEVKVSVTYDKTGKLQASISGDTKTGEDLNFTNRYQAAAASARIGGSKKINGRTDKITAGQFRFDLIENGQVIDTATNDNVGNYVFGRISYPTVGTHHYMIREQNGGSTVNGIKYDAGTKNVTINVTDDGSGTLKANGASDYSTTVDSFNNIRYGSIHVSKSWDDAGNSDQRPSSITVDLIDTETRETVQTVELSADNNWSADFGQLEAGRNYTVHEEPAGEYYTAQNNDQVVTADISGSAVKLVNTFTHPSVNIYANKVLNGGTLTNGEFTFNLYRNSDPDTVVQTAVNNAAGEIFFTGIAYDASGYTVKEAAGTDSSITYDTAAVTYDAEGNITSADHTEFTNTQRPIVLRVQKRSKAAPYDPLEGAAYGLYQVVPGGNDILIESERSDKNGYMYFGKIEPDTLYYFREISAPEGHEVDPYAGVKFQVKYTGSGEIGIFDENGDPTTVGDITSQDGKALLVQHTSEKTAIPGSASLTYSDDRIVAAAEAPEGAFDAGTTMRVTQLSGDDVKDATAILEAACGKIKNTVAYYNVGFVDAKGNAVEPKTGDVTVTIQYKDSLNMPEGTDVSALRIVHLKQSGGETGVQAVEGTIASASGELLQTSFTTDSFSTFGIVEPSESSSLNSSYLVTAAGVADQVSKLKVAKLDTSGKYVKGAKLQIIEKATGTVKAEWNTADGPEEFARWFDDAKTVSMNVDTDYILHEVSAPEGYELADDILFRINRYDSSITIYKYDESGKLVPDQEAIDRWLSDTTIQMIDVPVVHSKKTTVKQRVVGNERTIQGSDRVVRVSGAKAVKTGDTAQTALFAILLAAAVGVLLTLLLLRRKHRNDR